MSVTKLECVCLTCLTFLLCYKGTYGDSLEIEEYSQSNAITKCKEGLIADMDNFTLNAKITADIKTLQLRAAIVVNIYFKEATTFRRTLCDLDFSVTCVNAVQSDGCYCKGYRNGSFEFLITDKALLKQSQAAINILWMHPSDYESYSRNVTLPVIYPQERTSLVVGTKEVDVKNCTVYFDIYDVVQWCVYNLVDPIVVISFDYGMNISKTNCVRYTFRYHQAKFNTFKVVFQERRGCQRRKAYTCNWKPSTNLKKSTSGCTSFVSMSCGLITLSILCLQSMIGSLFSSMFMI